MFYCLPDVGQRQLCALEHIECTCKVATSWSVSISTFLLSDCNKIGSGAYICLASKINNSLFENDINSSPGPVRSSLRTTNIIGKGRACVGKMKLHSKIGTLQ